jgi:hypothetical protein
MVRWADDRDTSLRCIHTTCVMDSMNPGVFVDGNPVNTPHYPFVDDTLYGDLWKRILQAIAASIEACFMIFGARNDSLRPCPLSLEKFTQLKCSPIRQQLGLIINTNTLCICIPPSKLDALQKLITSTFHVQRKQFTVLEGATLLGNLDHLASHIPWFRHTYLSIRSTFNAAISHLHHAAEQSDDYIHLLGQCDNLSGSHLSHHHHFMAKWLASKIYTNKKEKFNITRAFQNDLALLRTLTSSQSLWVTPIPHIIPRTPSFVAYCDSCLTGAGGYSPDLKFFWTLQWPKVDPSVDDLLTNERHINILEYAAILITYAIAQRCLRDNPSLAPDSYPTILIHSDNTSAISWATKTISSSDPTAKHFARIACLLQLNARLGFKVVHIEGENNRVSDDLSRIFSNSNSPLLSLSDQIQPIQAKHHQLQLCSHYQVPPNLLSLVTMVLSKDAEKLVLAWKKSSIPSIPDNDSTTTGWNLLD